MWTLARHVNPVDNLKDDEAEHDNIQESVSQNLSIRAIGLSLFWVGLWNFLDYHLNTVLGGYSWLTGNPSYPISHELSATPQDACFALPKELFFFSVGFFALAVSNAIFGDVGFELEEQSAWVRQDPTMARRIVFQVKEIFLLIFCVMYWTGLFNIYDIYLIPDTLFWALFSFSFGFTVLVGCGLLPSYVGFHRLDSTITLQTVSCKRRTNVWIRVVIGSMAGVLSQTGAFNLLTYYIGSATTLRELIYVGLGVFILCVLAWTYHPSQAQPAKQGQGSKALQEDDEEEKHSISEPNVADTFSDDEDFTIGGYTSEYDADLDEDFLSTDAATGLLLGNQEFSLANQQGCFNFIEQHFEFYVGNFIRSSFCYFALLLLSTGFWNICSDHLVAHSMMRSLAYILSGLGIYLVSNWWFLADSALISSNRSSRRSSPSSPPFFGSSKPHKWVDDEDDWDDSEGNEPDESSSAYLDTASPCQSTGQNTVKFII